MSDSTEAKDIIDIATSAVEPYPLAIDELYHIVVPNGSSASLLNLERFMDRPRRTEGTTALHTQESFAHFVNEHKESPRTHLYADRKNAQFVAVFNDAAHENNVSIAAFNDSELLDSSPENYQLWHKGWGDHRAVLTLEHTPEWLHWIGKDNEMMSQVNFAEHVEDGLDEIHEPAAALVLEIAQTFHAHTNVAFRQATTLASGEQQFSYVENMVAGAGRGEQNVTIPKELVLGIAPFETESAQPYRIVARLRYRLTNGTLSLGYKLTRPQDVLRSAFKDTVQWIGGDTGLYPLLGKPRG